MAVVAFFSACQNDDVVSGSQLPIALSVNGTRADVLVNLPAGTEFAVTAKRCQGNSWNAASAVDVFKTGVQAVTVDGTGACSYSPVEYWKPGNSYRFRAVSPISEGVVNCTDNLNGDVVISDFTVNPSTDYQKDLLLSDLVSVSTPTPLGEPAAVALTFRHLLTNVRVQIIEDTIFYEGGDVFNITSVKLTGLYGKATYTGDFDSGNWSIDPSASLSCGVNFTNHIAPDSYSDTSADIWAGGLKLIPMTVSNQVNLVLDYTVSHNGGEPAPKNVVIPIPSITWEAGKIYTYQLALSEDLYIHFGNITVESWGSTQSSGTVIIR